MVWISELESAILGTINIGTFATEKEAHEATDKWLRETYVKEGRRKKSMLEVVNESFSDDVYVYEAEEDFAWEKEDD